MPNTLLTPQIIAREALLRLRETLVIANLVYRDYSSEFAEVGDTITIRKPSVFVADEFDGTAINLQDIGEGKVPIIMDTILDVSVPISSKEMTLDIKDFGTQVIDGAMLAIAQGLNNKVSRIASERIPFFIGTAGVTPNSIKTGFANPRKVLNTNLCPMDSRRIIFDPDAESELIILDQIMNANKSGTTEALREANMGRIMKMDTYMDQAIHTHTAGLYTALADVTVTGTIAFDATNANYSTIQLTSAAVTSTAKLLAGDLFTVDDKQYIVIEDTADAVSGVISAVKISPQFHVTTVGALGSAAVVFADVTAGAHVSNLCFHEKAIALITRPLELPMGKTSEQAYVAMDPLTGLAVRVVMDYSSTSKKSTISFDALFGVDVIYPQLATQLLG